MNTSLQISNKVEESVSHRALDVLIPAGLVLAFTLFCYQIIQPFTTMLAWSAILAVTLYPVHRRFAATLEGKQGRAATLVVILSSVPIFWPTTTLMSALGDSVHGLVNGIKDNSLLIPAPNDSVAEWPLVGTQVYNYWFMVHAELPVVLQDMRPKIDDIAGSLLGFVASIGGDLLKFLFSFVIAGIIMAFGEVGTRRCLRLLQRTSGSARSQQLAILVTRTVRAVALGIIGIASIQALIVGGALLVAGIPGSGVLALIVLVLGIAQIPALLVTLPAIGYMWHAGMHDPGMAMAYSILLLFAGLTDIVLKPLLLGRSVAVDAPIPMILFGALGGLATDGILGMFVGATLIALGYQIFKYWVNTTPDLPITQTNDSQAGTEQLTSIQILRAGRRYLLDF